MLPNVQVSIIVEADPEVLRDKRVQSAVEDRFCDSAISVREAALELVGRHIASHPDVGLQVCFKSLNFYIYPVCLCGCTRAVSYCIFVMHLCSILKRLQKGLKILG